MPAAYFTALASCEIIALLLAKEQSGRVEYRKRTSQVDEKIIIQAYGTYRTCSSPIPVHLLC